MSWAEDDWGKPFFPTRFGSPHTVVVSTNYSAVTMHNESAIIAEHTAQQLSLVFKEAKTTERKKIAGIQTLK